MKFSIRLLKEDEIFNIIPLVEKLSNYNLDQEILKSRFKNIIQEDVYECVGLFHDDTLIGCSGLRFLTRHYAGKVCEPDHVFIEEAYRSKGIGKKLFQWIYQYAQKKGCEAVELNAYSQNQKGHKFYFNEGFELPGFHYVKKLS